MNLIPEGGGAIYTDTNIKHRKPELKIIIIIKYRLQPNQREKKENY